MEPIQIPEEKIREMAEKYAIEGAEKAIREYYTGYQSPYVKRMTAYIESLHLEPHFDLPDLTAAINKAISHRVSEMANDVITHTYLPRLNRILSGYPDNTVETQQLWQRFCDYTKDVEGDDFDEDALQIKVERESYGFVYVHLYYDERERIKVTLMRQGQDQDGHPLYVITGLPGSNIWESRVENCRYMRIRTDDGKTFETPVMDDVLSNDVLSWLCTIMLNKVKVLISSYHRWTNRED